LTTEWRPWWRLGPRRRMVLRLTAGAFRTPTSQPIGSRGGLSVDQRSVFGRAIGVVARGLDGDLGGGRLIGFGSAVLAKFMFQPGNSR
jgi:hypothetical protein